MSWKNWKNFPFWDLSKWYRYSPPRSDEASLQISNASLKKAPAPSKHRRRTKVSKKRVSPNNAPSRGISPQEKQANAAESQVENVATQLPRQAVPQPAVPWVPLPSVGPAAIPGRFDECLLPDWPIHQTAQHAAYRDPRFTVNQGPAAYGQEPDGAYRELAGWPMQELQRSYEKERYLRTAGNEAHFTRSCILVAAFMINASILIALLLLLVGDAVFSWAPTFSPDPTDTLGTGINLLYKITTVRPPLHWYQARMNTISARSEHQRLPIQRSLPSVCVRFPRVLPKGSRYPRGASGSGCPGFPFALCHLALFCCPSLGANLEPERIDALMTQFATRARHLNRVSQPFMMLGNGSHASKAKFTVLLNDLAAGVLAQDGVDWYKAWNYTGIVLRWPDDTTAEAWHRMAPVLRQLSRQLASRGRNLRLGVALRQDSYGSDLERIAAKLGKTYLFLLPPSMEGKYYEHTLRYFSERTLGTLDDLNLRFLSRNLTGYQCYLFPADTYTYRINPPDMTHSLGPGIRGPVTNYAGRMAYFETCKIASTYSKHIASYGVEAVRDDSLLAYTEPQLLGRFADYMHNTLSATCMGIWNPHMDDFGGVCGSGEFPLTGALFRPYNDTHG
ncbi:hypothetical protein HPB50_009713 [Hyalomma asiaticum]|uniref:Uncharacterized protein n=1 Tax=Hyalomma asiaticum TaxID=266040 RepID=A0ACB7RT01_HYAAI|nr:hypothetical protein HPB50_009713 [Hyalomma asiaticum]